MSTPCPACGVTVVAGYAKCPKCHAALPHRRLQTMAGGTVSEDRRFPVIPIAAGGGIILLVVIVKVCSGGASAPDSVPAGSEAPIAATPGTPQVATPADRPFQRPDTPRPPSQPNPSSAGVELERVLRGRRLWSTIDIASPRIDVRSGSCDDATMNPTIDTVVPTLRNAGFTRLRCLAQSGSVVFERDL